MRLPWKTLLILGVAGFFIYTLFGFLLIKPGDVTVLGKELHGLRRSEVAPFLQITEKEWMEVPLEIQVQNKTFTIDKKALSLQWDVSRMKNDALHLPNGAVPITFLWDDGKVNRVFSFITEKINRPPQNASWSSHQMTPSRPGMQLNLAQALEQMRSAISQGQSTIRLHSFDLIPPAVGTSALLKAQRIPYLLSHHETSLLEKDEKTRFNIQKAADTLSGIIVEKGYPFSFNQVVGPAEKKDGYLETKVVVNGKLIPGYGGGVCQVSSTLYNALLKTDAKIIERSPHSGYFPTTSYVLPGLDAAVSDGFKDLRFTFPDQKVILLTFVENDHLVAEIWGEVENKTAKKISTSIRSVQQNGNGEAIMEVETVVQNQKNTELHYSDTYRISDEYAKELTSTLGGEAHPHP